MGRGKIDISPIESSTQRQVTFSKRNKGLRKKAEDLSKMCDAQISLLVFSSSGKLHSWYSEHNTTLEHILEQYHDKNQIGARLWDAKHQDLSNQIERIKKENDSIQLQLRQLKGEELQSLPKEQLGLLEQTISDGIDKVRRQKEEVYNKQKMSLQQEEVEYEYLRNAVEQMENANRYEQQQTARDFCFRVQHKQPNLHLGMY